MLRTAWRAILILFVSCIAPSALFGQQYFPNLSLHDVPRLHDFRASWFSKHLKAMAEPSLFAARADAHREAYRFLLLPTFSSPICIRLDVLQDGTGILTTKVTNGQGGYEPGELTRNETRPVKKEEVRRLLDSVEELKYWKLPGYDDRRRGFDGTQWILEAIRNGKYHVVDRWEPEKGPIRTLGLFMLHDLAKVHLF